MRRQSWHGNKHASFHHYFDARCTSTHGVTPLDSSAAGAGGSPNSLLDGTFAWWRRFRFLWAARCLRGSISFILHKDFTRRTILDIVATSGTIRSSVRGLKTPCWMISICTCVLVLLCAFSSLVPMYKRNTQDTFPCDLFQTPNTWQRLIPLYEETCTGARLDVRWSASLSLSSSSTECFTFLPFQVWVRFEVSFLVIK